MKSGRDVGGFLMSGSPEVYRVTSVCHGLPEEAASVELSARPGYKSNAPHLNSTLQLAQPQLGGSKVGEERGGGERREERGNKGRGDKVG